MNKAFKNENFWILYLNLFGSLLDSNNNLIKEIKEKEIEDILKSLSSDFTIKKELTKIQDIERLNKLGLSHLANKKYTKYEVQLNFNLESFQLILSCNFDISGSEFHLFLIKDSKKHLLGWRDGARFHPFCIKYEEFKLIINYLEKNDNYWKKSKIPTLLLMKYVGFGKDEQKKQEDLIKTTNKIMEDMNLKYIQYFSTCSYKENCLWLKTNLGWEFKGQWCYSLRNSEHKENKFPFKLWNELIVEL